LSNVARIDSSESLKKVLDRASKILREGGIVAFPTESFYGLGVDATNPEAIHKLYKLKKRDKHLYTISIPMQARIIGKNFWPGGITMVFWASPILPAELTASRGKVGIRVSSHPIANRLSQAVDFPITATSANLSGTPPSTCAHQVAELFENDLGLILDSGVTEGKNASTVIDVTVNPPVIIREGIISMEKIINRGILVTKQFYFERKV